MSASPPQSSPPAASAPTLALKASLRRVRISSFAKITIPLLLVVGFAVGISGYGFYRQNDERHRSAAKEEMRRVAWLLAASIDADPRRGVRRRQHHDLALLLDDHLLVG